MMNRRFRFLALLFFLLLVSACNLSRIQTLQSIQVPEKFVQSATVTQTENPIYMKFDCVNPKQSYQTARVVKVIDGDSILVKLDGDLYEVRYIGVNTPEYDSKERSAAIRATKANEDLLFRREVLLFKDISNTDKFGRLLRYVFTDREFVNLELVRSGFAESRAYPPDTACQKLFADSRN